MHTEVALTIRTVVNQQKKEREKNQITTNRLCKTGTQTYKSARVRCIVFLYVHTRISNQRVFKTRYDRIEWAVG